MSGNSYKFIDKFLNLTRMRSAGLGLARPEAAHAAGPASTALERGLQSLLAQNRETTEF
jgi:hypothetical protein